MTTQLRTAKKNGKGFLSLQAKIWIGFTLIFTPVFVGSYYWFYQYTTARVLKSVTDNLANTITGAVKNMDVNNFVALYNEERTSNPQCPAASRDDEENGYYPTNPRYWNHVRWLGTIQNLEPKIRIYTYVKGPDPGEIIAIGSTGALRNPRGGFKFCERYLSDSTRIYEGLTYRTDVWDIYKDNFGYWITTYMPIPDETGRIVGAIGMDIPADYVETVRQGIWISGFIAFFVTYVGIFVLVYIAARVLTRPIIALAKAAEQIGEGNYDLDLTRMNRQSGLQDEIDTLLQVFQIMMAKIARREQNLRQEIQELRIEIDEVKRKKHVAEIIESDVFQNLQEKARAIRASRRKKLGLTDE